MKNLKLLFLLAIVALFLTQCDTKKLVSNSTEVVSDVVTNTKTKVDETKENIEVTENQDVKSPGVELNSEPPVSSMVDQSREKIDSHGINPSGTILTTIKNYQSKASMSGVSIKKGEELICTTNESGACDLTVNSSNTYTISKATYLTQNVKFDNYLYLKKSDFYLKSSTTTSNKIHLKGTVKNGDGNTIYNVKIKCGGVEVDLTDGKYSLDIPRTNQDYSLEFENGFEPSQIVKMTLNTNQDSVIVDVFIDGFNLQ